MKIAVGALLYEGNTFSLGRSGIDQFEQNYFYHGQAVIDQLAGGEVEISGALEVFQAADAELVPLFASHGGCGGSVRGPAFDELQERLLLGLREERVDGVFLALHGAMVSEGSQHPEVDLLRRVRQLVGREVPIVITYDLHAHITPELLSLCNAIVGYQHYPHDDTFETGVRGARALLTAMGPGGQVRMAMKKLSLLVSPTSASTHATTPMRDMYKRCRALEAIPGILAVSYFPLTPWAEYRDGGTAFVAVTDGTVSNIDAHLSGLCEALWQRRSELLPELVTLADAIAASKEIPGPIVLSEMSDAVGAGSSGDSVFALASYIDSGQADSLLVQVVDPDVVAQAQGAGIGTVSTFLVGHKTEVRNGPPVELRAIVERFHDGQFVYSGGLMSGIASTVGDSVILKQGQLTIFVTSKPAYEYADEQYRAAGLDPTKFRYIVVKNPMNYRHTLRWAAQLYALDTPGSARADLRKLEWLQCERPFFPLDDDTQPLYRYGGAVIHS